MKTFNKLIPAIIFLYCPCIMSHTSTATGTLCRNTYIHPVDKERQAIRQKVKEIVEFLKDIYQIDLGNPIYAIDSSRTSCSIDDTIKIVQTEQETLYSQISYIFENRKHSTIDVTNCTKCNKLIDFYFYRWNNESTGFNPDLKFGLSETYTKYTDTKKQLKQEFTNMNINFSESDYKNLQDKINNRNTYKEYIDATCENCKFIMKWFFASRELIVY